MLLSKITCCLSNEELMQIQRSRLIDDKIAADKIRQRQTQKIVLLGVGESGKSTFLKQMQIIHGDGFSDSELLKYRSLIYENIIKATIGLINGKRDLKLNWVNPRNVECLKEFIKIYENLMSTKPVLIQPSEFLLLTYYIKELWNEESIIEAFNRRREFPRYFVENLPYYMDNFNRITRNDYMPTQADILHSRRATNGILEVEINIKGVPFLFIDVGGQRTQRQKWQQCLSDVTAILFLVSSSEYDEYLRENVTVNRLDESCKVFETLVNYSYLGNVEFILFLNKYDLLKEKIKICNIKEYCKDFQGDPRSISDVEFYLQNRFVKLKHSNCNNNNNNKEAEVYTHFTTAVDTNNIRTIFEIVRNMIFNKNCRAIMLS